MNRLTQFTTGIRSKLIIQAYKNYLKKGDRVLDLGCGDGILSEILQNAFVLKLTGCDIENYLWKKIPFVAMGNESILPFPDNSFDTVMVNDMLHHISYSNQKKLLREALRVSNKVLIFEDEPTLVGLLADWIVNKFHNLHMPVTLTHKNHLQWVKLFESMEIRYKYRKIHRPFFYPFSHECFYISKK